MSFHLYKIDEVFSYADGSVQYIELFNPGGNGEQFLGGHSISVTQNGVTRTFTFPSDLPSSATAGTHVLIATQAFADLHVVTPDYIIPSGFLFTSGSYTINYASVDSVTVVAPPTDGTSSLLFDSGAIATSGRGGTTGVATPTDFLGTTGTMPQPVTTINGTAGDDSLVGSTSTEAINGLAGNDTLEGAGGNDTIDGGAGTDVARIAVLESTLSNFDVASGEVHIAFAGGNYTLRNMDRIQLDDQLLVLDTHPGEAAWNAAALLYAGFGAGNAQAQFATWMPTATASLSMAALATQMVTHYAPGISTPSLVAYLYNMITGTQATAAQVNEYSAQVGAGKTFATQGDLVAFGASLSINTDKMVEIVGTVLHLDVPGVPQ